MNTFLDLENTSELFNNIFLFNFAIQNFKCFNFDKDFEFLFFYYNKKIFILSLKQYLSKITLEENVVISWNKIGKILSSK